jgi:DNA-binding NarL/FixJ family response regulator
MPDTGTLRIVLADDNFLVRQGTAALLAEVDGLEVVEVTEDPAGLLAAVATHGPDAVLTDLRMPPTFTAEGIEAAKMIRRRHPGTGVVVLSQYVDPDDVLDLLSEGVAGLGYLLKERVARVEELVAALHAVVGGGSALDPQVVEALVARRTAEDRSPLATLTDRERTVLAEMATGKTNIAIARTLYLSERAVEKHTNSLFAKLGLSEEPDVNRRVRAVLAFLDAYPRTG